MPNHSDYKAFIPFCVITTIAALSYYFWRLRISKTACDSDKVTDEPLDEENEEETMGDRNMDDTLDIRRNDDGDGPSNGSLRDDEDDRSDDTLNIRRNGDGDGPSNGSLRDDEVHRSDENKIYVSNINYQVRRGELKDFFSYFGHVTLVNLLTDRNRKRSRGLAFVTFSKRKDAERAKSASDYELTLDGRVMKCSAMQRRPRRGPKDKTELPHSSESKADETPQVVNEEPPSLGDGDEGVIFGDDSLINTLPDDILIKIFSYLTLKERICIESVCRRWRKVCEATWLSQSSLHFTNVFKGFSFSNEQVSVGPAVLTDAIFKSILFKGCYNLKHLDISASPRFLTTRSLNCIGQVCRELRSLNLSCSKVDNNSIKTITNGSRKIEKIILTGCQELGEKGVWWLFHNCENLCHIDLRENRRIIGKCFYILNKNCKIVLLDGCCSINDKGLDCLTTKCGESLEELDMSGCLTVTDKAFNNMTERCKSLQVLKMCGVHSKVTSAGLRTLVNLTTLNTLHLTYHQGLSDAVLSGVAHHCTRLRELRIDGCALQNITDAGMQALAYCPCLEVLNISYHGKVTDAGIKYLALAGRLRKLVARSLHITDQGIGHLAAHCLRLYELDVCGCTALTINSVQVFLEARETMTEDRTALVLNYGGTAITKESSSELGDIDSSVTVCLQNFNAPPGQCYPSLPYDDRSADSNDESDKEDEEDFEGHVDPLDDERPLLNLAAHLSFPLNRLGNDIQIEYLQVPAESNEPWDGVLDPDPEPAGNQGSGPAVSGPEQFVEPSRDVPWGAGMEDIDGGSNPEPAGHKGSRPVVSDPEQFLEASGDVPWIAGMEDIDGGVLDPEPAGHQGSGPVVSGPEQFAEASRDVPWVAGIEDMDGVLNPEPADMSGLSGPGHFAHANPELAQFVDVEEHLMAGDHRRGGYHGDWSIAEEDVDDFLDADDPAYMNDMFFS